MRWHLSNRFDPRVCPLADRHYNRRKIGSPQFAPPGRCLVLVTENADAFWITSWPFAEYVRHAWPGAWVCSAFRNESPHLSSELIREAIAATVSFYGYPGELGMITFVDSARVRAKRDPGRCFIRAGFQAASPNKTKGGLHAFRMAPCNFPLPIPPLPAILLSSPSQSAGKETISQESQFTMSADLTPDQKSTVKSLFAEISESEATCAALVASEKARQAELITKLHAVAGPRPYSFEGKTVTPVVRAKKGSTTGEKEAFLRGRTVPEVTSLD